MKNEIIESLSRHPDALMSYMDFCNGEFKNMPGGAWWEAMRSSAEYYIKKYKIVKHKNKSKMDSIDWLNEWINIPKKEVENPQEKERQSKDSNLNDDGSLKQDAWGEYIITYDQRRGI